MNQLSEVNKAFYKQSKSKEEHLILALHYFHKYNKNFYDFCEDEIDVNLFADFVQNLLTKKLTYNTVDKYVSAIKNEICLRLRSKYEMFEHSNFYKQTRSKFGAAFIYWKKDADGRKIPL